MKIHLKNSRSDHLTLCKIWVKENWVLKEFAQQQSAGALCKTCRLIAGPPEQKKGHTKGVGSSLFGSRCKVGGCGKA